MGVETLDAVADRGYYASEEIRACEEAGITVTLPKPMTSNAKAAGRFGKQDFVYIAADDVYICPARERLTYRATTTDAGKIIRRYWTSACRACALKSKCTPETVRRVSRWEHEAVLETVQARLDHHPEKMTIRRQTAEHPFGTIKCWMGATHFSRNGCRRWQPRWRSMCSPTTSSASWRSSAWPACWRPWRPEPRKAAHSNRCQQTPQGAFRAFGEWIPGEIASQRTNTGGVPRVRHTMPFLHSLGPSGAQCPRGLVANG